MTRVYDHENNKYVAFSGKRGKELLAQFNVVFPKECTKGSFYNLVTKQVEKIPDSKQKPKSLGFNDVTFLNHDKTNRAFDKETKEYIIITSIDPAIVNLAIRVEKWYYKTERVEMLYYTKVCLNSNKTNNNPIPKTLQIWLESIHSIICDTDFFIIERQLIRHNPMAGRVFGHMCAFFMTKYSNANVVEIDPKLKTKILCTNKTKTTNIKKWAIDEAKNILTNRNDEASLKILEKTNKKDDLADVVIQTQAFWNRCAKQTETKLEFEL
jgi:hypothetical protein